MSMIGFIYIIILLPGKNLNTIPVDFISNNIKAFLFIGIYFKQLGTSNTEEKDHV
jgi:nucleoside recognition membrane protein YjiH